MKNLELNIGGLWRITEGIMPSAIVHRNYQFLTLSIFLVAGCHPSSNICINELNALNAKYGHTNVLRRCAYDKFVYIEQQEGTGAQNEEGLFIAFDGFPDLMLYPERDKFFVSVTKQFLESDGDGISFKGTFSGWILNETSCSGYKSKLFFSDKVTSGVLI